MDVRTTTPIKIAVFMILAFASTFGCAPRVALPPLIAHRGASFDAPENTLAAFRLAWEQGADGIEGDFHLTRDGHIVCLHDTDTERTADRALVCAESTLDELRRLDVGSWKAGRWKGERLPTLAEVLGTVPAGRRIFIEIKCGPKIVPALEQVVKAATLEPRQMVIISFDEQVIAAAKRRLPELAAYWLVAFERKSQPHAPPPSTAYIIETARQARADGVGCQAHALLNEDFVQRLAAAGLEAHVWTVNKPGAARRFARLGVASITTDRPGWLRQQFDAED